MKLFLDDIRTPDQVGLDSSWRVVRSVSEAKDLVLTGMVTHMSLDHDLGYGQPTGYNFLCFVERLIREGKVSIESKNISLHTQNSVGKKKMLLALSSLHRWERERRSSCDGCIVENNPGGGCGHAKARGMCPTYGHILGDAASGRKDQNG